MKYRLAGEIRERIDENLSEARAARQRGDWDRCWRLLEDAHVLSQPWAWPHVRVHGAMFAAGFVRRDVREVRGQLLRLVVAGPASTVGKFPVGNTGRARVSALRPMPIRPDLAAILDSNPTRSCGANGDPCRVVSRLRARRDDRCDALA